jgi:hypothetical protein
MLLFTCHQHIMAIFDMAGVEVRLLPARNGLEQDDAWDMSEFVLQPPAQTAARESDAIVQEAETESAELEQIAEETGQMIEPEEPLVEEAAVQADETEGELSEEESGEDESETPAAEVEAFGDDAEDQDEGGDEALVEEDEAEQAAVNDQYEYEHGLETPAEGSSDDDLLSDFDSPAGSLSEDEALHPALWETADDLALSFEAPDPPDPWDAALQAIGEAPKARWWEADEMTVR